MENSSVHYQRSKSQINYSNKQYYLLIANKYQKLLNYCLFEELIEDLEEWKQAYAESVNRMFFLRAATHIHISVPDME